MFNIAHGNGSVAEIARATDYTRQSVQRLADTLVADGLATYAPDPHDRRRQIITLTAKGSTLLDEMEADFDRWSKRLVQALGKENVTQTIEQLHELKRILDSDADNSRTETTGIKHYDDDTHHRSEQGTRLRGRPSARGRRPSGLDRRARRGPRPAKRPTRSAQDSFSST